MVPSILATAGVFIYVSLLPRTYQAQAIVTSTNVQETDLKSMPTLALAEFFRKGDILEQILREANLDKPPYKLTLDDFCKDVLQIDTPRGNETIDIAVRLPSAVLARDVANVVAHKGVDTYLQNIQAPFELVLHSLKEEEANSLSQLAQAESTLEEFEAKSHLPMLRQDVESKLAAKADRIARRARKSVDSAAKTEHVRSLTEAVKSEPVTVSLDRQLAQNPEVERILEKIMGKSGQELMGLHLGEMVLNPVHYLTRRDLLTAQAEEAELKAELGAIDQAELEGDSQLVGLHQNLVVAEEHLRELTFQRDQALSLAKMSQEALRQKKLRYISPPQILAIISAAIPTRPIASGRVQYAIGAFIACFAILSMIAVLLEARSSRRGKAA